MPSPTRLRTASGPKVAFIDLDGTLLNSTLEITEFSIEALRTLAGGGLKIVLASGRPLQSIARFAAALGQGEIYVVASNGGCVCRFPSGEMLQSHPMAESLVKDLLKLGDRSHVATCVYMPDRWFASESSSYIDLERRRSGTEPAGIPLPSLGIEPIIKVMFVSDPMDLEQIKTVLDEHYAEKLEAFYTYPEYLEVMPAGISKVVACDFVLEALKLDWSDAVVLGDGLNDLTMMKRASLSVAVSNAHPHVQAACHVLAPSNDEDGVAHALLALCRNEIGSLERIRMQTPE